MADVKRQIEVSAARIGREITLYHHVAPAIDNCFVARNPDITGNGCGRITGMRERPPVAILTLAREREVIGDTGAVEVKLTGDQFFIDGCRLDRNSTDSCWQLAAA